MNNITALTLTLLMAGPASAAALTEPTNRVINLHEMEIKAGKNGQYDEVARDNITRSLAEQPGTLAMYSLKHKENAHQAYMIEIYASEDAYQQHLSSEPYRSFITRAPDLIGQKKSTMLVPQFLGDKPFVQNKETINNLVIVDVKPTDQQAFRDIVLPEMAESLKVEPGVLAMYAATDAKNRYRWFFYEIYASDAAYQQHREPPHFRDYIRLTAEMTDRKEAIPVVPALLKNRGALNSFVN